MCPKSKSKFESLYFKFAFVRMLLLSSLLRQGENKRNGLTPLKMTLFYASKSRLVSSLLRRMLLTHVSSPAQIFTFLYLFN